MLLHISEVLRPEEAAACHAALSQAEWIDGRATAGYQSARTKHNLQLAEGHPLARKLSDKVVGALEKNPLFMGAALPLRVFPPLFNRYEGGGAFGTHVDNAIRQVTGTSHRIRTEYNRPCDGHWLRYRRAQRTAGAHGPNRTPASARARCSSRSGPS